MSGKFVYFQEKFFTKEKQYDKVFYISKIKQVLKNLRPKRLSVIVSRSETISEM